MMKIGQRLLIYIYVAVVVIITVCIFSYNRYGYASFGEKTIFVSDKSLDMKSGILVIADKHQHEISVGDSIFYYNSYEASGQIILDKVTKVTDTNNHETTYSLANGRLLSSEYLIGSPGTSAKVPLIGFIFNFVTSYLGYFVFVMIPMTFLFVFQVYSLYIYVKKGSESLDN